MSYPTVTWLPGGDAVITIMVSKSFFGRKVPTSYRGSCTVWHNVLTGARASTSLESRLADIWQKATWLKQDQS
jgi:hypothetical protein